MSIQTTNGYTIDFPKGIDERPEALMESPFRGETVAIPFVIRGTPGLIDVRFKIRKVGDTALDYYIEIFTATLRPGGWFTNAFGHKREELLGELTVPRRLFPIEVAEVLVDNVSDRLVQRTDP